MLLITHLSIAKTNKCSKRWCSCCCDCRGLTSYIGAGIAAVEQMKEQAELTATQWILAHEPNMTSFSLKTLSFEGKN